MNSEKVILEWFRAVRLFQIGHLRAASACDNSHRSLGIAAVIFSTIVGTSIFATLQQEPATWVKVIVGLLSITAAVLSSLQLFLKHADQAERHRIAASRYGELRREIEGMSARPVIDDDEWQRFQQDFRARWAAIDKDAPTFSQRIHDRALKDVERRTPH